MKHSNMKRLVSRALAACAVMMVGIASIGTGLLCVFPIWHYEPEMPKHMHDSLLD